MGKLVQRKSRLRKTINSSEPQIQFTQNNITAIEPPGAQPKIHNERMFWGPGGEGWGLGVKPQPLKARGSGGGAPTTQKNLHFLQK